MLPPRELTPNSIVKTRFLFGEQRDINSYYGSPRQISCIHSYRLLFLLSFVRRCKKQIYISTGNFYYKHFPFLKLAFLKLILLQSIVKTQLCNLLGNL